MCFSERAFHSTNTLNPTASRPLATGTTLFFFLFFFSSKHKGQFRKNKYVYEPHFFPPQIKLAFWSPVYGKTCSHKLETTLQFECLCGLYRLRSPFWACVITPRQLPNLSSGKFQTVPSQSVLVPALEKSVSGMKLRGKGTWGMGWRR